MNMNLLSVVDPFYSQKFAPGSAEALEKAASYGLPFSLFGFALVFGVLAVIMLIVIIFGKVFGVKQEKPQVKEADNGKKSEEAVEKAAPVETVAVASASPASDNGSLVAAIMAAISAFRSANGVTGGFRVVSFKKRK